MVTMVIVFEELNRVVSLEGEDEGETFMG